MIVHKITEIHHHAAHAQAHIHRQTQTLIVSGSCFKGNSGLHEF